MCVILAPSLREAKAQASMRDWEGTLASLRYKRAELEGWSRENLDPARGIPRKKYTHHASVFHPVLKSLMEKKERMGGREKLKSVNKNTNI